MNNDESFLELLLRERNIIGNIHINSIPKEIEEKYPKAVAEFRYNYKTASPKHYFKGWVETYLHIDRNDDTFWLSMYPLDPSDLSWV